MVMLYGSGCGTMGAGLLQHVVLQHVEGLIKEFSISERGLSHELCTGAECNARVSSDFRRGLKV